MTTTADSTDARRDPSQAREAPVADWVTIPQLYRDPFPVFERLRAEGGVHWVPAVGRYLISSYAAVHETELDQTVYSANEERSLQKRAMGHSMLRKDDPGHHGERKAWQPVLRPSAVKKAWRPIFEQNAQRYLEQMRAKGPEGDLVWDFAAPYAAGNLRAITGLHNVTQQDMQRWSQTMIDATGNYADDPEVWARGQASFDEVDAAIDEMLAWHRRHPDHSVLSALVAAPEQQMPLESIRANMKMTIGGGLNEPRDALGMAVWAMLEHPDQLAMAQADPALWHSVFDEAIRWVAPIGMYSRQTTREVVLEGVRLPAGAKLGICLLSANRDQTQWPDPERFDLTRRDQGAHLAFGKGVHVCLGAWVARAEVADVALPALFRELPHLRLDPQRPAVPGGWVFRGMDEFPVLTDDPASSGPGSAAGTDSAATTPADDDAADDAAATADAPAGMSAPRIAVVGAGPAGCYTAQAILRRLPAAQISVLDSRPAPFGLVRSGVAADHQGTKSVTEQFSRLFEVEGVEFIGSVRVRSGEPAEDVVLRGRPSQAPPLRRSQDADGAELSLEQLRESFDTVVVATGLTADASLEVPGSVVDGAPRPGLHGAGRITRALNSDPQECAQASFPSLGRSAAVVGMGNVAMDVVRLALKEAAQLEGSDLNDDAHQALVSHLQALHVIGRSLPAEAKFDPVMLREIVDLPGIDHVVHGVDCSALRAAGDPRSEIVARVCEAPETGARGLRVEWWFGQVPAEVSGRSDDGPVAALDIAPCAGQDGERSTLEVDAIVSAIGFRAGAADLVGDLGPQDETAVSTGRVEPGLYLAGWARRGPRGTIPAQRADARELAELIAQDLGATHDARARLGSLELLPYLDRATDWHGWKRIDAAERQGASAQRVRAKLHDAREQRLLATAALLNPTDDAAPTRTRRASSEGLPKLSIVFGTESGNAELVAEELGAALSEHLDVTVRDIASLDAQDPASALELEVPHLMICSTYGDGELPVSARPFCQALREQAPSLEGLRYAVFGLGDHSYHATYSRGGEILDETLRACGAQRVGEFGRHDAAAAIPPHDAARAWAQGALEELTGVALS